MKKNLCKYFLYIFVFMSFPMYSYAEHNTTADNMYNQISKKVLVWSDELDKYVSNILGNDSNHTKCLSKDIKSNTLDNIDTFFKNNKYINETEDIYVRLRMNTYLDSRATDKINFRLSAQLPFDRCKKQLKLFIEDPTSTKNEIKATDTSGGGVGLRYTTGKFLGVNSRYTLGLRKLSPYVRARYKFKYSYKSWMIEPIQSFKYSSKYYFEEETNIYFDNHYTENYLFRLQLHRKSATELQGTDYGLTLQHYSSLGKNAGLEISQSFFGNTHYNNVYSFDKKYSGINNYVTSISWRENIWRKWLYYEIRPSVNFHKDHDYTATYKLRFIFDIYFGEYN